MKVITRGEEETKKEAFNLAKKLTKEERKESLVLALKGDLGSGKTIFSKGFASYFNLKDITSPTFVIFKKYNVKNEKYKRFYHIDLYRVEEEDIFSLGLKEILEDKENIIVIEWADKLKSIPERAICLEFEVIDEEKREIKRVDNCGK